MKMKNYLTENKKVALSDKAIKLIWHYYQVFAPSKNTVTRERASTLIAIRRAQEDCLKEKDFETYKNIEQGTKGWESLDDFFAKIKLKR